ncbi:hypothetical protein PCANC_05981 [Puccinia coronata f. sp. avenae]|uniref:PRELI/MSF1 domain-containing protein n=1 Tax=Puccinia coronata f. sp. avenae TaxID=200324 RepID=A0A2N5VTZ8_9BASI|nr:hypothetical protein PCANC_20235 [Puccinia coronata f. sp. avenae]PLW14660.1 hypothetical protein PCASD_18214 [Puccinia coronata f. sp. avenae]PLW43862.1 hypothetical protein PCASD_05802 [Puccinia coronata f. sp. avenae]PLW53455.1 hypothetical protein PCANC_05981 [Puccinia coronata f. sp. avenae]
MVLSHLDELIFPHPFRIVCQAFTLRYPNPFAPHVITVDTIERNWDAESGILRSSRLVLKRGTLPSWAPKGILEKSDTWVLEESTINLLEGTMTLSNRNLDHRRVMEVVEKTSLRARGEVTEATTSAQVTSSWGFYAIRKKIEQYGISRLRRQSRNSRHGLELIIKLLRPSSALREPLLNAEPINYPPSLAPASPLKSRLRELRLRAQEKQRLISEMLRPGHRKDSTAAEHDADEYDDHEDDSLTAAEEAELDQLENEFSLDSSAARQPESRLASTSSAQQRRWFWWWRWHLGSEVPSENKKIEQCCKHSASSARE